MVEWFRFERYARFHALYLLAPYRLLTYCGREVAVAQIRDGLTAEPRAQCSCCCSRLARPYLIPESLRRRKEAARP